jgi:hypothetical protein
MRLIAITLAAGVCAGASGCQRQAQSTSESGAAALSFSAPIEVASGQAHRGPWRMNRSDWRFVDDPAVAVSGDGTVAVAWADHVDQEIFVQLFEPGGERRFDEPVNLSRSPGIFSWLPRLVMPPGDAQTVYAIWQDIVFRGGSHGGEIFFARSKDGGASFSEPYNLSDSIEGAGKGRLTADSWHNGSFDLARGEDGTLYAAWTAYEGRLALRRSKDGGQSWDAPVVLVGGDAAGELPARGPSLAAGAGDTVHLAWTVGEDPAADIRVATSTDGGQSFGPPELVAASSRHADAPRLAVGSRNTLHLAYAEADRPFGAYEIRYARRGPGEARFSPPRAITSADGREVASVHFPALAVGEDDALYVLWERFPSLGDRPRGLGLTRSADGGQTFAAPIVVPGSNRPERGFSGSQQGLLMRKLDVAGGHIAIVNSTFAPGQASHIWLHLGQMAPAP